MKKIPFCKYHANGNDFIIISSQNLDIKYRNSPFISRLCNRHLGIGADGLIIVSPSEKYDFCIDYYNADGSWETFCANGSRCAVKYQLCLKNSTNSLQFESGATVHSYKINSDGLVSMSMKIPVYKSGSIAPLGIKGVFVDSGARHFICESDRLDDEYVFEMGRKIRNVPDFHPKGINVNFYRLIDSDQIEIKTYEKGVEQVMLSCSSGSAAVVFHLACKGLVTSPAITLSSGGNLSYTFDDGWQEFYCEGPAKHCYSGEFNMAEFR